MRWTQITERLVDDVVILDLSGQVLQVDSEDRLVGKIHQLLSTGRTKILLNLVDLPYVDNDGLGKIVDGYTVARQGDGVVKLCGVAQGLLDFFKANQLDSFLEVFEFEHDAVQSFDE